ncbi:hypothetical protein ABPG74_004099 [Tetrahymena malaccensis]
MQKFQRLHNIIIVIVIIYAGYVTADHLKNPETTINSYFLSGMVYLNINFIESNKNVGQFVIFFIILKALTLYYCIPPGDFMLQFISIVISQIFIMITVPKEINERASLVLWNLGFISYHYIQHKERKISYFLKQKQYRVDQLIKNNIFQQIILTQFESTTQQIQIYEKNDQMNQLLNEKDLSDVKLCFESFVIPEEEQKSKDIHSQNLYAYTQQMHFEMDQQIQKTNSKKNLYTILKSKLNYLLSLLKKKAVQNNLKLESSSVKKRRKFSTSQQDFKVFKVINIVSDIQFYVRVKAVHLDCPLVMVIFENLDIVKNNNKLKKFIEINNLLNTKFFFEIYKKCQYIKWAMKQKQIDQIQFFFSLLQNNVYSIMSRQQKKEQFNNSSSPLLKKRQNDSLLIQSAQFSPVLKFKIVNKNNSQIGKLNLINLFNSLSQQNSNQNLNENKLSCNVSKQSLCSSLNRNAIVDVNSYNIDKKSYSVDDDKQEQDFHKLSYFQDGDVCHSLQEISQRDIIQKQNIETNYQFSQMYKNQFQITSNKADLVSKLEDKQQFSKSKDVSLEQNEINLSPTSQLKSLNQFQSISKNNNNNSLLSTQYNLLQSPSQETSKTNQNNLNTSNEQQKYNNYGFNFLNSNYNKKKSFEKNKKQIGSLFSSVSDNKNKRNSLQLVQDIVLFQLNQLNLQSDKSVKSSQLQNKNIQFSSVFQDKEQQRLDNKDKDQINEFDFQDIIQELNIFQKFVKIKIDQALLGLKISNNKEAMLYVLKSFLSSVIALNYINSRRDKQSSKSEVNQLQDSHEIFSNQRLKMQEQVQNEIQIQRFTKDNSTSSLNNYIQSSLQKSKEVSFTPNLKGNSAKKLKNNINFSSTPFNKSKGKINQVNQSLRDEKEESKTQSFFQNTNILLNSNSKDRASPNNQEYKQYQQQDTVLSNTPQGQTQNKLDSSSLNFKKLEEFKEIQFELQLETNQLTKYLLVKIANVQKDELISCINFNTNNQINQIEYESIKEIIQKIGPSPLSYYQGNANFAFLVDLNQVLNRESGINLLRPTKSELNNENLLIIPEEQEIEKKSFIKLSPVN